MYTGQIVRILDLPAVPKALRGRVGPVQAIGKASGPFSGYACIDLGSASVWMPTHEVEVFTPTAAKATTEGTEATEAAQK
jgi:hypothetical protein